MLLCGIDFFTMMHAISKFVWIFIFIFCACDDGDFVVTSFDFTDQNLESCETGQGFVFYKTNNTSFESISLSISAVATIFEASGDINFILNASTNVVNYRKYDGELPTNYFCATVPPTTPQVTNEFIGNNGVATFTIIAIRDDNDGIEETEDDTLDTDQDGLPNYYDFDDDGDNVNTLIELGADFIAGVTQEPQDTDADGTPDYLDTDDDNDGILTRYEDINGDLDPTNDIVNGEVAYLTATITTSNPLDLYKEHSYQLTSDVSLQINNLILSDGQEEIIKETLAMGTIEDFINREETITPTF